MKYMYNLYNKLVFKKHNMTTQDSRLSSTHSIGFRNRINRLNRASRIMPRTTTKKFNY